MKQFYEEESLAEKKHFPGTRFPGRLHTVKIGAAAQGPAPVIPRVPNQLQGAGARRAPEQMPYGPAAHIVNDDAEQYRTFYGQHDMGPGVKRIGIIALKAKGARTDRGLRDAGYLAFKSRLRQKTDRSVIGTVLKTVNIAFLYIRLKIRV